MLPHTNCTFSVDRLVDTSGEKAYVSLTTLTNGYLQPMSEQVVETMDWQTSFRAWLLMVDNGTDILIGDKVTVNWNKYYCYAQQKYSSFSGHQQIYLRLTYN